MPVSLPSLPYDENALAPHISHKTMAVHYGKHHAGYVQKLNDRIAGTDYADMGLEAIIQISHAAEEAGVFNNAAQIWNHMFFWDSMRPSGGGEPSGSLAQAMKTSFGSYSEFREAFVAAGTGQFGSGWVWLVSDGGKLSIATTSNAGSPLLEDRVPLLTCDVWEHAYYLDYQNGRRSFLEAFVDALVNWEFAEQQFQTNGQEDYWTQVEQRAE